ncbi:hypothetical protein [Vibrio sp. 99-8-1]|uniref:hypothetical protein n=1 Tax=Vibrio sp. 99-8-1 TaxID=2607602 RepID=UPI001493AA99|nr:hypothetical protein [Vibrio sp. 99-8-1]NOI65116.1 hypothetical protein [Vibrio sp. 99-8-1]
MYEQLRKEFENKGIPLDRVDLFDHPNFLRAEQQDASYLVKFAQFVAEQPYSVDYLAKAEKIIEDVCAILSSELIENGRKGACADIAGILSRILELKGVWSCPIKGSSTINFPEGSNEETTYFWSVDSSSAFAGHAWVFAPPFAIIDITLKQQPYSGDKKKYIPEIILVKDANKSHSNVEDIISPEARLYMQMQGIPKRKSLDFAASQLKPVQTSIPACNVLIEGTDIKYSPVAIFATDSGLPSMTNMQFKGKSPYEMYKHKIEQQVGSIT